MARDYIDTVRKLLAKAQGASTPEESEAFTAKATELMFTHQIDEATLGQGCVTTDALGLWTATVSGYARPKVVLLSRIAEAFDCQAIRTSTGATQTVAVFGWEADLETVKVLYASLEMQAERQATRSAFRNPWDNARTHKTSFLYGFASEVSDRLKAQRTKVRTEHASTGTALALFDRAEAAKRYAKDNLGGRQVTQRTRVNAGSGYYAGRDAGARADLGGSSLGGARKAVAR